MLLQRRSSLAAVVAAAVAAAATGAVAVAAKPPTLLAHVVDGSGADVGVARFVAVAGGGTQITVDLHGLPPGLHGMHVHESGSCTAAAPDGGGGAVPFSAAGGHFDPAMTHAHKGPDGGGHAGDLPMLHVDDAGNARLAVYAAGLALGGSNGIAGKALVVHANPDNYTDTPPNGGSGTRIACGPIGPGG